MHPSEQHLALLAGGDLSILDRARLTWHVRSCTSCQREVAAVREAQTLAVSESLAMPAGLDWDRLSAEMNANIKLGLEAGRIVARPWEKPEPLPAAGVGWRASVVMASLTVTVMTGWFLYQPAQPAGGVVLSANQTGIEWQQNDRTVRLTNPKADAVAVSVSTGGVMRARYVDDDTGQVTINNVYAE